MPKVSVLVPVHNAAPYLAESIGSILSQTFRDFELIAVDDGSSDGSKELLEALAMRDRRIRLLHLTENRGIVGALNTGLELCTGEYVARMDGDDLAHPERLRLQLEFLEAHRDHVACGCDLWMFGARHWYARYPRIDAECKSLLALFPCLSHPAVVLRRSALDPAPYREDYRLAEDYKLWVDLIPKGRFANIPRPLVRYRIHPGQSIATASAPQRRVHARIAAERLLRLGLNDLGAGDVYRFLWPLAEPANETRSTYLRHARRFVATLWRANPAASDWLRVALVRVMLRNLLLWR